MADFTRGQTSGEIGTLGSDKFICKSREHLPYRVQHFEEMLAHFFCHKIGTVHEGPYRWYLLGLNQLVGYAVSTNARATL